MHDPPFSNTVPRLVFVLVSSTQISHRSKPLLKVRLLLAFDALVDGEDGGAIVGLREVVSEL